MRPRYHGCEGLRAVSEIEWRWADPQGQQRLVRVDELCESAGVSIRQLDRLFRRHLGVRPKTFAQIARFQSAIALLEREVSGEGQWVESSLLAAQIAMLDFQGARWTIAQEVPEQSANANGMF